MTYWAFVTNAADGTVSTFSLDSAGALKRVSVSDVGPGCSTLVVDSVRRQVHVAVKGETPAIVTCRIGSDGSLSPEFRRGVESAVTYLAVSPDGSTMVAASYGGGFGISMPVNDNGLGDVVSRVEHPNMHSCAVSPDGRTAYFVSLGADLIVQCGLNGSTLTPLDPPTVAAPRGSGPRHLVIARGGRHLYVLTEFSGEVLHYTRGTDGTLTLGGSATAWLPGSGLGHSRFGADPRAEHLIWGADIHLSADERFCWASERTESTLATVPIGADGAPQEATHFTSTEPQPRGFGVSPDGKYLLCTGEMSSTVSLFRTQSDGGLVLCGQTETGKGGNWARFMSQ